MWKGLCRLGMVVGGLSASTAARTACAEDLNWTENFFDDPIVAGRFLVPAGQDAGRFSYDFGGPALTVHYNSSLPTAWYLRPIDANGPRSLGRCEDFDFTVKFLIHSQGFIADPNSYAQIGWGLINSQTTGKDRAGGSLNGPYAYDSAMLDYYPNVTSFGGPTLGATVWHSDVGDGYFSSFDFPFGPESDVSIDDGDETPALDVVYTASVHYDAGAQTATLTLQGPSGSLAINADGAGGPGGLDGNPGTIQTTLFLDSPFVVDTFALTAWEDTFDFDPESPSVVADVDVYEISFFARTLIKGDMNRDGRVDGLDIAPFVDTLLTETPEPCAVTRADFSDDDSATTDDVPGFEAAMFAP